ncbi:N-acetylglucosamine-6-phosphate deacetylase [Paenibacillus sp. GCM10023248]|uniref:N-acetylglucosamine-6-phosphate deacetylase n=1 Tax=unclassified Paenibacillus TaxID=185978 RepID=UPI00237903DD|nr:amidohydrolase family protein [Paenibacillus sp. MAHUQ-63]MDD9267745.1 amidohydrolase family protein [Paenibacillus sp. MAHUQ-63]
MDPIVGRHYRTGAIIEVTASEGCLQEIQMADASPYDSQGQVEKLPWIAPGLVDLQINGYLGMDFNQSPLAKETVIELTYALWREGVTSYYPTVITNADGPIEQILGAISEACRIDPLTRSCIRGIHLEGPFISPEDGPRGAHGKAYVKAPDWELFQRWQEAAEGRIAIVTMSPEWPEADLFIRQCAASGVIVSIGHTNASPEQIRAAIAAGAQMSTHLGNAAHLMLPRHPNYIWEQLAADQLWACMIADGFHLPESVLKVFMKVKGDKAILVSDAVYLSGLQPGTYTTHIGGEVMLAPSGKLHLADNPNMLAGSAQMMLWGIQHLVKNGLSSLADAWDMASVRPSAIVGLPAAQGLEHGAPADFVLFESKEDGSLRLLSTYKSGKPVYTAASAVPPTNTTNE